MLWIVVRCGVKRSWGREISSSTVFKVAFQCFLDLTLASSEYSADSWIWSCPISEAVLWWSYHTRMVCCLSPHAKLVGDGGNTVEFSSYISLMVLAAINVCVFMPLIRKNRSLPNGTMQTSDCSLVIDRAKSAYSIVVQFRNLGTMCPLGHLKRFLVTLTLWQLESIWWLPHWPVLWVR